jgi:di/tricarboxylate transporter
MNLEIALTLGVLLFAVILFTTEIIRVDLVALIVLVALVLLGLVAPEQSISGFSNPAVVTTGAVFVLSAGLARTGVAAKLAEQLLRISGKGESRLLAVLMGSTAALSAFILNVGVVAMFLPVTLDIARRTGRSASRLLMPMVQGTTIGGMMVLIGTASNLVVVEFFREAGLRPPGLFDFTPVGGVILIVSVVYMLLLGRRLLPDRKSPSVDNVEPKTDFRLHYELQERLAMITIPEGSPLAGKTLDESRFGRALGLNILSVMRGEGVRHIPEPYLKLEENDRLLVLGRLDTIDELSGRPVVVVNDDFPEASCLFSDQIGLAELEITEDSSFNGKTLVELDARKKLGVNLLALRRNNLVRRTNLREIVFQPGDRLLFRGPKENLKLLNEQSGFGFLSDCNAEEYSLDERLLYLRIPKGSSLAGNSIKDVRLATGYGIAVLNIIRDGEEHLMPDPLSSLEENDLLVVEGRQVDIDVLRGHQTLVIDRNPRADLRDLETESLTVIEVMLSPHTTLSGKTLRQLNFREKFGVSVLAIWRGDRSYRTGLNDMPLQFGDALLCYGNRDKFALLAREQDFVILNLDYQEKKIIKKAPLAGLIMAGMLTVVLLNWLPIYIAAIAAALLMILTGCLTMEEAYRSVEWESGIFNCCNASLRFCHAENRGGAADCRLRD